MTRAALFLAAYALSVATVHADAPKIDRTIGKEPVYRTKTPEYALLVFGPEGKDRVWLVRDGDTLYVDRNGNGDLTEPGEKVAAEKRPGQAEEEGYSFDVGAVMVGGRTHKGLTVAFGPLKQFANTSLGKRPDVKAALAKNPKALAAILGVDVEAPGMKGGGLGGRLHFMVGPINLTGVFQFADKPANAPAVLLAGPLQITFYADRPTLRVGGASELVLVVGTPGVGPGTFAMLGYEDTIPATVKPVADVSLPSAKTGAPPLKEKWEIKQRC